MSSTGDVTVTHLPGVAGDTNVLRTSVADLGQVAGTGPKMLAALSERVQA